MKRGVCRRIRRLKHYVACIYGRNVIRFEFNRLQFFAAEFGTFSKDAADLLLETGVIKKIPDLSKLADTRFIQ